MGQVKRKPKQPASPRAKKRRRGDGPALPRAKKRGDFHHGDLREALVGAALQYVEAHGYAELSLRPLAQQLGVSQPAVYRHFASKDALLAEVSVRCWQQFETALGGAGQGAKSPGDALRNMGRAYVRWAHAHPHLFRLLSSRVPAQSRDKPLPPLPREHYFHGLGGAVPIDEPKLADAFRSAWAHAHGLATFVVEHVFQLVDTDEARLAAADAAIDVFVEMLTARWPPSA